MAMTSILVTLARMASVRMVGMDSGMHFTGCPVPLITETCLKKTVQHYGLDTPGSPLFACRLRLSVTIIVTLVGWGGVGSMSPEDQDAGQSGSKEWLGARRTGGEQQHKSEIAFGQLQNQE
uniref:HDC07565 n=1 Tax=Drosophila melanogaster TaxID=7227 RepID=Q6IM34_DROME|nr:TPA_inf: HDC07565 [Drosophila melanogaster]